MSLISHHPDFPDESSRWGSYPLQAMQAQYRAGRLRMGFRPRYIPTPVAPPPKPPPPPPRVVLRGCLFELIQQACADDFGVTVGDLVSHRRSAGGFINHRRKNGPHYPDCVTPRLISYYLGKRMTKLSLAWLGLFLGGRNHTTILSGVRNISARIAADPEFAARVQAIRARIEESLG